MEEAGDYPTTSSTQSTVGALDRARNMVVDDADPAVGPIKMTGNPIKLSAFPDSAKHPRRKSEASPA